MPEQKIDVNLNSMPVTHEINRFVKLLQTKRGQYSYKSLLYPALILLTGFAIWLMAEVVSILLPANTPLKNILRSQAWIYILIWTLAIQLNTGLYYCIGSYIKKEVPKRLTTLSLILNLGPVVFLVIQFFISLYFSKPIVT